MIAEVSRTSNITRNILVTLITQILLLLFAFANRTIFIKLLGEEYLGLDGLFTSILTIFSLAELGIGNALIFSLYKPLAEKNYSRCQQYLSLYDKAYRFIILSIFIIGFAIIPFLDDIVNVNLDVLGINIYVVYLLFLFNTVSSYFLAHRQAVLLINQRQSTISLYQTFTKLIVYILECVVLLIFSSYYIFLIIRVAGNYVMAIMISEKAKITYPHLCISNRDKLPKSEITRIKKDVYALFIRRVGGVVLTATDNIVINSYISLAMVGIYSNYVLIITAIQTITTQVMSSMTASIGNFVTTNKTADTELAFKTYSYITYLVYGFCSVCLIVLTNRFIELLWGEQYLLSRFALYLIVLNFYFFGFQSAINVFRDTTGLFTQGKYRSIYSALINVIASILLVKPFGVIGVIMGTIISRVLVSAWYDPYILYKCFFKTKSIQFFIRFILYLSVAFIISIIIDSIASIFARSIWGFVFSICICLISIVFLYLPFAKTSASKDFIKRIKGILK